MPSNTFIATWLAVTAVGALPVAVEPDLATYNIDPNSIGRAITPRTRAIIMVHLYGQPADADAVNEIADNYGFKVIEDAAQGHGARYRGRRVGSLADVACFSFYPGKNLGAFGDGGAITTHDAEIADRVRQLRNYGSRRKYEHDVIGANSRLDELQAAFLRVKLRHLDEWNARRGHLASIYRRQLRNCPGLILPHVPTWSDPVWHLYVIRHRLRDELQRHLAAADVGTMVHYPNPPHRSGAYAQGGWTGGPLPISERMAQEVLSLPMGPQLSDVNVGQVAEALQQFNPAAMRKAA